MDFSVMRVGIGFFGGLQGPGSTTLVPTNSVEAPTYAFEGGAELTFPVDEVFVRAIYATQNVTTYTSTSSDATGTYYQAASGNIRFVGGKISVNMATSQNARRRFYIGGGGGIAAMKAKMLRQYTSGSTAAHVQEAKGSAPYWDVHTGFGWFLAQNWSFYGEGGFRHYNISNFVSTGNRDLTGSLITGDGGIKTSGGARVTYKVSDLYLNFGLLIAF